MSTLRVFVGLILILFASAAMAAEQQGQPQKQTQGQKQVQGKRPLSDAGRGPVRGMWWQRPDVAEKIQLTDEQRKKLDALFEAAKKDVADARQRVAELNKELNDNFARAGVDETQFLKTLGELNTARNRMLNASIMLKFDSRKVLTKEQVERVRKEYPEILTISGRPGGPPKAGWRRPPSNKPGRTPAAKQKSEGSTQAKPGAAPGKTQ